jgi:hypothetical protein
VVYPELVVTGMPGVQVEFLGVDWEKEKSKSERGHVQRKARNVLHRKNKAYKKMAAAEMESLKRFRRFLHSMNNDDELQPLLTQQLVWNFYGMRIIDRMSCSCNKNLLQMTFSTMKTMN